MTASASMQGLPTKVPTVKRSWWRFSGAVRLVLLDGKGSSRANTQENREKYAAANSERTASNGYAENSSESALQASQYITDDDIPF